MKHYFIINPAAGQGKAQNELKEKIISAAEKNSIEYEINHTTCVGDAERFVRSVCSDLTEKARFYACGGDGTLSEVGNGAYGCENAEITVIPVGTGNDFAKDLSRDAYSIPRPINWYIKDLPIVEVHGKKYRFFNGVGFGIDGYCCQVGDELRKEAQEVNYTSIAVKGLLRHFDARSARITVDGETFTYEKVWIAPTMYGRYYGGGMMAAPDQRRWDKEKRLSLVIFHGAGRLRTLCIFPSIFKGRHINHKKYVTVHTGTNIKVEFDRPTPLQIDGETVPNVTSYTAFI